MPFIAVLGCDGSGKSAVIHGVSERLSGAGHRVTGRHWRPRPFQKETSEAVLATAQDPHAQRPRGFLGSLVKLVWIWLNWWVGWWTELRGTARKGFLIFDRFHEDMRVDPRRYRFGGPEWLVELACRTMPQPDLVIYLDAPAEVLLSRKQEVSEDALEVSRQRYRGLCEGRDHFRIIDASQPLAEVIEAAFGLMSKR